MKIAYTTTKVDARPNPLNYDKKCEILHVKYVRFLFVCPYLLVTQIVTYTLFVFKLSITGKSVTGNMRLHAKVRFNL